MARIQFPKDDSADVVGRRLQGRPCNWSKVRTIQYTNLLNRHLGGRVNVQSRDKAQHLQRLHCHLSGIEYGLKGERNHLMLAESDFNLEDLLQALHDLDCGGRILCESPEDMDLDAQLIKNTWEDIAKE